ncbi:hypothetical protein [Anaerotruncus colihominis]|uniref:hypothetical protein n=1 Tax=Anaerotruncus colihominis TaxID=169435 RepID=UPI00242AE39F|nr:hypothetical protein [Anaerotruncus colihominis]
MYESDRRRAAPLTSLYMQRTPAARAVSPRMARTDAIQRPVEPPNPPIVESAQPVLPLGGAPVQARISPGSKPERIARRRAQRAPQPAAPDGEAIASMVGEYDNNPPSEPAFGENENNPPAEPEAVGPAPAPRRPGFWDREYAEGSVLGGIQFFRNHYLSLEGAVREDCRAAIATHIGRVPTRDEVQDNLARGVTGFNAHRHPLFGGWAHGRCVQTPLHAFSTAVGLQARTDNIQISLKGVVQNAKLCTTR